MTAFKQESTYLRAKDALATLIMNGFAQAAGNLTRLNAAEVMEELKAKPEYHDVLVQHGFY